ncbi:MAG: hypothetical protein NC483_04350 [Ruminococcus sp.]|nr:hypothetical protein [Ruminococcus sp.]
MRKYYEYFGLALIMVFSFYYTDKIASIVLNKNPLMVTINEESINYNVKSVNAEINGDYIIPGLNGLEVNVKESFYKMQENNVFNKYFLVYDQIRPEVSLEKNKDKIINKGNSKLNKVSFIFEVENDLTKYFQEKNLKASLLINLNTYKKNNYFEVINNEIEGFKALENTLNLNKENKHICVINNNNKDICLKNKNYLIEPSVEVTNTNLATIKKNIFSGSIILIKESATLNDLMFILKEVNYKDLEIDYVSELIKEDNY